MPICVTSDLHDWVHMVVHGFAVGLRLPFVKKNWNTVRRPYQITRYYTSSIEGKKNVYHFLLNMCKAKPSICNSFLVLSCTCSRANDTYEVVPAQCDDIFEIFAISFKRVLKKFSNDTKLVKSAAFETMSKR